MGDVATLVEAGYGNKGTITQGKNTRGKPGTNPSESQQQLTSIAPGESSRINASIVFNTQYKNLDRATPQIGDILDPRTNKLEKKFPFDTFMGNISDYTVNEIDNTKDVMDIVNTMTEPNNKFERQNNPKEMTKEQLKSAMNRSIKYQRVKLCINMEH